MGWSNGIAEWIEGDTVFVSAVFSWNAQKAYMRCVALRSEGYHVRAGGQAVNQNPAMFAEFDTSGEVNALSHHNPDATFTSRGCIRNCSFCLVPKLEGKLIELDDWEVKPIICDNNLLATSQAHFDKVIDRLLEKRLTKIDFNQGLDARILTTHHASRFSELPKDTIIRLAWDNIKTEKLYLEGFEKLVMAGIKTKQIRTYVLIGYKDTPADARYRLEKVRELGALPNPMRYQPLDAMRRNSYVGESWTNELLTRYMRYWSNLKITGAFLFDEYRRIEKLRVDDQAQMALFTPSNAVETLALDICPQCGSEYSVETDPHSNITKCVSCGKRQAP
jgi:hypothetical protein